MRIIRIIARLNIGGPAIQSIFLSGPDVEPKYRSKLVCGQVGRGEGDMSYLAKQRGVKPIIIPELGREISPWKDLSSFLALRRLIRNGRAQIVHTHTAKAGTLGRLAIFSLNLARPKYRKIKTVHTFHGHVFHSYFGRFKSIVFRLIERWLARGTDRIVVLSDSQHRDIVSKFRIANSERVRIVPLGFDLSPFRECGKYRHEIRSRVLPRDDLFCLGMIGRLTAVKNIHLLLEAVAELKTHGEERGFFILIIGDGEQRRELEQRALTLGIANHIAFTGWQRDLPLFYSALDGVVLTSRNEGTPVALVEAMAADKPIIATKVGGVVDLLGSGLNKEEGGFVRAPRGILISSGDTNALAKAMVYLKKSTAALAPW